MSVKDSLSPFALLSSLTCFVPNYYADDVAADDLLQLFDPHFYFVEWVFARNVVHEYSALWIPIVDRALQSR